MLLIIHIHVIRLILKTINENLIGGFLLQSGNIIPVSVKEGDKVLLPEYGGTKINLDEKVCFSYNARALLLGVCGRGVTTPCP